jgi:hypothetical protein
MALELARLAKLDGPRRIALIFSVVIAALVFAHNQPWPYVFIMALPFMALWAPTPFDALAARPVLLPAAWAMLAVGIAGSFVRNADYLGIDNHRQLDVVGRAESLLGPRDVYFDGVGMLPNRMEPSTLWLDRHTTLAMLSEGRRSELYRVFAERSPRLIIWSYRMDAVAPLVGPLIRDSYVQVAPNIRLAGARLRAGQATTFDVPLAGGYALYDGAGRPLNGQIGVDGTIVRSPVVLGRGRKTVTLAAGRGAALLLPVGAYLGKFASGRDDPALFAGVYD